MSMEEESNEVRVKDEPIYAHLSISNIFIPISGSKRTKEDTTRDKMKVKEEPLDIQMQTSSKFQMGSKSEEVEVKAEEKFSATEEFANKTSIAFLNEDTTTTTKSYDNPASKTKKSK